MWLVTNRNNVITYITNLAIKNDKGVFIIDDKVLISEPGVQLFEVKEIPKEVVPQEYCYKKNTGFYKNPDYKKQISNEQYEEMKTQIQVLENAFLDLLDKFSERNK